MKYVTQVSSSVALTVLFLFVLTSLDAFGQYAGKASKGPTSTIKGAGALPGGRGVVEGGMVLKLQKLTGLGKRVLVKAPEYRTTMGGTVSVIDKEWAQVTLTYATAPEWIDELTFQFYAVSESIVDGKKVYNLFKSAVKYGDIEKGSHVCTMFLRPSAAKRFGDLYAVAVEVLYNGKVIDEMSEESKRMGERWWRNPAVMESPDVVVRDGYLINRAQSPFSLMSVEGLEFIK